MSPTNRKHTAPRARSYDALLERPAQAAYRNHVLYHCQALRDEQCGMCTALARDAAEETRQ